jgi:streptogramin lyase
MRPSPPHHAPWTRLAAALAVLALGALASCDCSSPQAVTRCTFARDCADGFDCVDGTCQPRMGRPDGGGEDATTCVDRDRDGYPGRTDSCATGTDCDDDDASRNPGATELCGDGIDQDCDSAVDEPDCACRRGRAYVCYTGPAATRGVGACRVGVAHCVSDGMLGDCRGEVVPAEETCNGVDDDCDGAVDEGLRNACGECAPERDEVCGNDVDDDCDGLTDEDCNCDYRCACAPGTSCACRPPTNQPCYEGPPATAGVGACRGGRRDCLPTAGGELRWGMCAGQVLPSPECAGGAADGVDQNCDGRVDEGCRDRDGDGSPWPTDCDDDDPAIHPGAAETCNGLDDDCDGVPDDGVTNACGGCGAPAAAETCGNGLDDDCNGRVDDGCTCTPGETSECYRGPADTRGVGTCRTGTMRCEGAEFSAWTACEGDVGPLPEVCNGVDDDCDGEVDERWAVGSNACGFCDGAEICDGMDNDCDGLVDEGVANRCGTCGPEPVEVCNGADDDCDGIVDDGVTNACGTCPPEPCFTETWPDPAACDRAGRGCRDVVEHPDHPGAITLGQSRSELPLIYIASTQRNLVAQINTDTGAVNWLRSSHGTWPSRTSVARDGSVWVGNRGFGNPNDPNQSNLVHLDIDGNFICRADVVGLTRAVGIDGLGNVWAGTWNGQRIWKVSGTEVDTSVSPARCRVLATYDVGVNIYGLTVDPDGYVWTASTPSVRLDTRTGAWTTVPNPWFYGIAPDGAGNIWLGGWSGSGPIHAIRRSDFARFDVTGAPSTTAITVHPDGTVWASSYGTDEIISVDPTTRTVRCRAGIGPGSGSNPHGVAVDRMGRIWMPNRYGGYVNVYDTSCRHVATYPVDVGQELYSYSDMTGHLLRTFTAPEGAWTQVFDSGYDRAYWTQVTWRADVPAGAGVEVSVQAADTEAGLAAAPACGPFTTSPADLAAACPALGRHRYLRVTVRLTTTRAGVRPIVYDVGASWAY